MAEFGWNGATGSSSTTIENVIAGGVHPAPASSGEVDSITVYLDFTAGSGTYTIKCAIYQYNGGSDPTLITNGQTEERTFDAATQADGNQTFNFTGTKPQITAGVEYLLVAWANLLASGNVQTKNQSGQSGYTLIQLAQTYAANFPSTLTGESASASRRVNIYATYTESASRRLMLLGVGT